MLDAYIIEEIKKREEATRQSGSRPRLQIPVWPDRDRGTEEERPQDPVPHDEDEDEDTSGPVRIDL